MPLKLRRAIPREPFLTCRQKVELLNHKVLILRPSEIESFRRKEPVNSMILELALMCQLGNIVNSSGLEGFLVASTDRR